MSYRFVDSFRAGPGLLTVWYAGAFAPAYQTVSYTE